MRVTAISCIEYDLVKGNPIAFITTDEIGASNAFRPPPARHVPVGVKQGRVSLTRQCISESLRREAGRRDTNRSHGPNRALSRARRGSNYASTLRLDRRAWFRLAFPRGARSRPCRATSREFQEQNEYPCRDSRRVAWLSPYRRGNPGSPKSP